MYKIATVCVSGVTAVSIDLKPIPRGITGAVVEFLYDDDIWAGLRKKVAFRGSGEVEILCDGDTVIFPTEVAQRAKTWVTVGITGVNADGTVVIPTKWADLGAVADSAYGDYPAPGEPVPPVWAQLLAMIGTLANLNTEARENLVAAINEVLSKAGTGGGNVDLTGYATEVYVQEYAQPKGNYLTEVPEGYARTEDIPTKPEDIGALPDTYIPPDQTAQQVGADPKGTATAAVYQHNTAEDSHGDIRLELKALSDRLTAFFDSDDATLDELSEIVAYITGNKSLIESITTSKVSVADIVDNLTTNVSNKPLSAAQGVVLKGLIDGLSTGKLDASALQSAVDGALAKAKANGEFDGEPGKDGADGYTPVKGKDYFDGKDGANGKDGADGKSAYAYAQEGGYTGTEEEFAQKLAAGSLLVTFTEGDEMDNGIFAITADKTVSECIAAYKNGTPVYGTLDPTGMGYIGNLNAFLSEYSQVAFNLNTPMDGSYVMVIGAITGSDESWMAIKQSYALKTDIPTALENPNALTINGVSYDGSDAKDITDTINSMIDAKLAEMPVWTGGAY